MTYLRGIQNNELLIYSTYLDRYFPQTKTSFLHFFFPRREDLGVNNLILMIKNMSNSSDISNLAIYFIILGE